MNILTIIALFIIAAFTLSGYRRGFVRVVTSMFFFLAISALVYFLTPYISDFLKKATPVYEVVQEGCREALERNGEKEGSGGQESLINQKKYIENMDIPEILKDKLISNNNDDSYESLGISGFTDYIATYMANIILNLITFVVTVIAANIIWRVGVMTLNSVSRLPVIHGLNRYAGMAVGAIQGILIIWLVFLIITVCGQTEAGQKLMIMIHESPSLEFLYNANVFLKFILDFM